MTGPGRVRFSARNWDSMGDEYQFVTGSKRGEVSTTNNTTNSTNSRILTTRQD